MQIDHFHRLGEGDGRVIEDVDLLEIQAIGPPGGGEGEGCDCQEMNCDRGEQGEPEQLPFSASGSGRLPPVFDGQAYEIAH